MSDFKPVSGPFFAAAQISEADIEQAALEGFTTIINNRPDDEEPGQPASQSLQAKAEAAGLQYHYVPVTPGHISPDQVQAVAAAMSQSNGKVLGFCRSGMRSTCLWALSQAGSVSSQDLISAAAQAGYDIAGMKPRLDAMNRG